MTATLKAFHNDPAVKDKYVNRMAKHRRLEQLVQGTGWEPDRHKGCAVGCTLNAYRHDRYPIELGLPEWLARLEDWIFEKLPKGKAEQFAEDFLQAIPVGANVEPVRHLLGVARIDKSLERLSENKEPYADECRKALGLARAWHESQVSGPEDEVAREAAREAAAAAWSAASAAREAAAAAWSAASAARSAASAARCAAWSAAACAVCAMCVAEVTGSVAKAASEAAAWSVAWSAHAEWEAATLLKLLSEAAVWKEGN